MANEIFFSRVKSSNIYLKIVNKILHYTASKAHRTAFYNEELNKQVFDERGVFVAVCLHVPWLPETLRKAKGPKPTL